LVGGQQVPAARSASATLDLCSEQPGDAAQGLLPVSSAADATRFERSVTTERPSVSVVAVARDRNNEHCHQCTDERFQGFTVCTKTIQKFAHRG